MFRAHAKPKEQYFGNYMAVVNVKMAPVSSVPICSAILEDDLDSALT